MMEEAGVGIPRTPTDRNFDTDFNPYATMRSQKTLMNHGTPLISIHDEAEGASNNELNNLKSQNGGIDRPVTPIKAENLENKGVRINLLQTEIQLLETHLRTIERKSSAKT